MTRSLEPVLLDALLENFIRAESDTYFAPSIKHGNFGTIRHTRDVVGR
jgi:hypothetical protein